MKAFRINTDIKIKWTVSINGGTTPIDGTDLKLVVQSKARRQCLPFAIDGNTIVATFRGKDQVAEGTHSLTLWMNFNKDGQAALDHVDAFTLVPTTEQITDASDSDNLLTDASVELTGELTAAVKGDSAYEIWLNHGFTGTVEDFLAWLKGPKGDPGTQGAPGEPGPAGNGIDHIALAGTSVDGKRDMYTIFFTNGNTFNFYVNHGKDASIDAYTKEQINALLDKKVDSSRKVNGKTLDADISISGKDIPFGSGSDTIYQAFEALFASLRDSFEDIDSRFENLPSGTPEVHIGSNAPTGDEVLWIDPTEQLAQTTGQSTTIPMSQKAVSDAIAGAGGGGNFELLAHVVSDSTKGRIVDLLQSCKGYKEIIIRREAPTAISLNVYVRLGSANHTVSLALASLNNTSRFLWVIKLDPVITFTSQYKHNYADTLRNDTFAGVCTTFDIADFDVPLYMDFYTTTAQPDGEEYYVYGKK